MRLGLTVSVFMLWVGALVPALAIAQGGESVVRAAGEGGPLATSPSSQPLTLERPSAFERALSAYPSSAQRLELAGHASAPPGSWWVTRCARPSARALARETTAGAPVGVSRERTRGPPRRD